MRSLCSRESDCTHCVGDGLLGLLGEDLSENRAETHAEAQHVDQNLGSSSGTRRRGSVHDHFLLDKPTRFNTGYYITDGTA